MAKFGPFEVGAKELDTVLKWADTIFNSRIGLALMILISFTFGINPTLERIERNTAIQAESAAEIRRLSDMLVELRTECRLYKRCKPRNSEELGDYTTASHPP